MTEFHVGDRVTVKPEHDEVLRVLNRPTGPGTITDIMDGTIIVAEDGEAEQGVWSEGGGTSAPYDPDHLVLVECRVQQAIQSGVFTDEDDAVAQEAAWAEQMEAEGGAVQVYDQFADRPDAPIDPLDIPDHYDLPMFGSTPSCPKCGNGSRTDGEGNSRSSYEPLRTEYHSHGVLGEPCGERFGWPDIQNLGEHLCRICKRCHYGWPEAVAYGSS